MAQDLAEACPQHLLVAGPQGMINDANRLVEVEPKLLRGYLLPGKAKMEV